ncbi:hypothetical protein HanRHA438_Chr02g0052561 [Helianthus annuus]|nr:hypothetical protein HanRHA438_Chr02g0052561 [Helianthus annuus]
MIAPLALASLSIASLPLASLSTGPLTHTIRPNQLPSLSLASQTYRLGCVPPNPVKLECQSHTTCHLGTRGERNASPDELRRPHS